MTNKQPNHLRLHVEESAETPAAANQPLASAEQVCRAFQRATGWTMRYEPFGPSPGQKSPASPQANGAGLVLSPAWRGDEDPRPRTPRQDVEPLAASIAVLLGELQQTQQELVHREAELAAGVPVTCRDDEELHLSQRLQAALQGVVATVGATAAALYLLDEGTSELKLRASFGLPPQRLLAPARPLRGALADLEALVGHAVVIEDTSLLPHWRCPEEYPSAVCVPVSSATMPLGTLWIFSATRRDFTPAQTNAIELAAGHIVAELERDALLSVGVSAQSAQQDLDAAVRWQAERLPRVAPLVDDWDLAGVSGAGDRLAAEFFDWSVLPDGNLALAIGDVSDESITAGLSSSVLHATLRAHANYRHNARQMVERVNESLWTGSPGGHEASLYYGQLSPEQGELEYAFAGNVGAILVHADGFVRLARPLPPLGIEPETAIASQRQQIPAGAILVIVSDGVLASIGQDGQRWDEAAIAALFQRHLKLPARELAARLLAALGEQGAADRTILVAKRLRS